VNPREVLQERYPLADFSIYFRHLEACRTVKGLNTQDHHICPKKQFPEYRYSPENLITLTVKDHAHAHKLLEAACGIKAPPTAWLEAQRDSAAKGGRIGGRIGGRTQGRKNVENGTGIFALTPEQRSAAGRKGGRIGGHITGRKTKENGTGIFALTPEQRSAAGRIGGRKIKENGTGIFAPGSQAKGGLHSQETHKKNGTGCYSREQQVKGGRISGLKNVESGQLASLRTPEHQAKAGRAGGPAGARITNHLRWHVKRGIVNLDCSLCRRVSQQAV
jgi:hypothetical protein